MKFELIVSSCDNYTPGAKGFDLRLVNQDTGESITLVTGNSMDYLKGRGSDLFNGEPHLCGKRIHWCDGDDPNYDSCEYFSL